MKQLTSTLFIFFAFAFLASAQLSFFRDTSVQVIDDSLPLKNAWAGGINFPMVERIDLNGDGIMDMILYEPTANFQEHDRLMPFINHGDSGIIDYHYAPEYIDLFPQERSGWLVTYDYNCDGKMDLFTVSADCNCGIMVYRNDYTPLNGLKFTKVIDPIDSYYGSQHFNISANPLQIPVFADVDGDGAMDILGWPVGSTITLSYYRGLAVDSGWSCDSLRFNQVIPWCWADFALKSGADSANIGAADSCPPMRMMEPDSAMLWDAGAAFQDDTQSCICIYKQDGNRTKDLLIGGFNDDNMLYLHNGGGILTEDSMDFEEWKWPGYNVPVNLPSYPCAYHLDVNNDSLADMIIAPSSINDFRGIKYYKNTDITGDTPYFALQPQVFLQDEMIEVGTGAAPQIFDYDGDGLPDLVIGDLSWYDTTQVYHKGIALYKNIGSPKSPKFKLVTRDLAGLDAENGLGGLHPTFGDLNGDGAMDMIVGLGDCPPSDSSGCASNGTLLYYQDTAAHGKPASFVLASVFYNSIDVGGNAAPQLYDLNHDGLLDLIIGNGNGIIKYYQNIGSPTSPSFQLEKDTLGGIILHSPGSTTGGYASPAIFSDSGVDKLIVGTQSGKAYLFDNITGNIMGTWHLADSLINGEEGRYLNPAVADLNNDGYPDMIIGNYDGGVALFMNSLTTGINVVKSTVLPGFHAYPNPASDELHFNFYHLDGGQAHLEIVSCIGQTVYRSAITGAEMTVSLKNLSSGIYLARFVSDVNAQSLKIVVKH